MYANNEQVCTRAAGICFSWKVPLWCLLGVLFTAWSPAEGRWADTFYQYRIPVELKAEQTGWQQIPLSAAQITAAVNLPLFLLEGVAILAEVFVLLIVLLK